MVFDSELLTGIPPLEKCIWPWHDCDLWLFDFKLKSVHFCHKLHWRWKCGQM